MMKNILILFFFCLLLGSGSANLHSQIIPSTDPFSPGNFTLNDFVGTNFSFYTGPCLATEIVDCAGNCVDLVTAMSWIGDTFCDDGAFGMDLTCAFFSYDSADGTCAGSDCQPGPIDNSLITGPTGAWTSDGCTECVATSITGVSGFGYPANLGYPFNDLFVSDGQIACDFACGTVTVTTIIDPNSLAGCLGWTGSPVLPNVDVMNWFFPPTGTFEYTITPGGAGTCDAAGTAPVLTSTGSCPINFTTTPTAPTAPINGVDGCPPTAPIAGTDGDVTWTNIMAPTLYPGCWSGSNTDMAVWAAAPGCPGVSNCPACDAVIAAPSAAVITSQSTCSTIGGVAGEDGGGVLSPPVTTCTVGNSLEYATNAAGPWSSILPLYDQMASITVYTRCTCDIDPLQFSTTASVTTTPGACPIAPPVGPCSITFPMPIAGTCNNNGTDATGNDDYYLTDITLTFTGVSDGTPIELYGSSLHPSATGLVMPALAGAVTFTGVAVQVAGGQLVALNLLDECCFATATAPPIAACSVAPTCVVDVCYGLHMDQDAGTTVGTGDAIIDAMLYPLIDPALGGVPSAGSAAAYTLVYAFVDAQGIILDLQGSTTMDALPGTGYDFDPLALGVPVPPVPPLYDAYTIVAISYHTATATAPAVGDLISDVETIFGCVCTSMCEVHHLLCCNAEVSEVNPISDICSDQAIDASFVDPTENTGDPGGPFAGLTDYITEFYLTYEAYDNDPLATHPVNLWDRHLIIDHNSTGAFDATALNLYPDFPLPPGPGGACQTQPITYCVWGLNIKTDQIDPTAGILNNTPLADHLYDITNTNGDWLLEWYCYDDGYVAGPNDPPVINDPEPPVPSCTCIDVSQPICFEVYLKPQINAGADKWICENEPPFAGPGNSVQLCDALIGGSACSATWTIVATSGSIINDPTQLNPAAGTVMADPSLAVFTPIDDTNGWIRFQLRTEDPSNPCGFVQDFVTVYVNQAAHVDAGADISACVGSSVILGDASVGDGADAGAWSIVSGGGTLSNTAFTAQPELVVYTPDPGFVGTVTLALTSDDPDGAGYASSCGEDSGVCGDYTDTRDIVYGDEATALAIGPVSVCRSFAYANGIMLEGIATGGVSTGYWTDGQGSYSPANQEGVVIYTPSTNELAGNSLTLVFHTDDPVGVCTASEDAITIMIDEDPTANAGLDLVFCETAITGPITLSGSSIGGGANTGAWSIVSGPGSLSSTSQTLSPATVTFTPAGAGTTVLMLTTDDGGGTCTAAMDTRTVVIDPAANVNLGADQNICSTDLPVILSNTGTSTGVWSSEGIGSFSSTTSQNTTYTPSAADLAIGSVEIYFTSADPAGLCGAITDEVLVFFSPAAIAFAGPDQTVCSTSPDVVLAGSFGGSASSATWSTNGDGSFVPNASVLNALYVPGIGDLANGTVQLTLSTDNPPGTCGISMDMMMVTINDGPSVENGTPVSTCAGDAVAISVIANGIGSWTGGSGSFGSLTNPSTTYTPSGGEFGTITLSYTIADNDGAGPCTADSGTVLVSVSGETYADAGPDFSGCPGDQTTLGGNSSGSGTLTYSWSPTTGLSCYSCPNPIATVTQNRTYTLTVIGNCGTDTDQVTVSVSALPELQGGTVSLCELPYSLSAPAGYASYQWSFNGSNVSLSQNYSATAYGTYLLIVTDASGCTNSALFNLVQLNCIEPELLQDPCVCLNNATTGSNGQFSTLITVIGPAGQSWTVTNVNNFFNLNSAAPPDMPSPITVGTILTQVSPGVYEINGIHVDGVQFNLTVSNGLGESLTTVGSCTYPNPVITNLNPTYCSNSSAFTLSGNAGSAQGTGTFTIDGEPATIFDPTALGTGTHLVEYVFDESNNNSNHPGCIQSTGSMVVVIEDCYDPEFIGNYVWIDANGNGIQDANEQGMPGVVVYLYNADGVLIATTTTDGQGYYYFGYPGAGSYYILVDLPSGYTTSPSNAGGNDALDSDFNVGGTSTLFTIGNSPNLTIDLGLVPSANCDDFEASIDILCSGSPGEYYFQPVITINGGNPGTQGYLVNSTHTGGFNGFVDAGDILYDGPFISGSGGYSYTITVAAHPECSITFSESQDGCGPTPIELLNFTGKVRPADNYLQWATATEVNSAYFTLYRSDNGTAFYPITTKPAAGNSTQILHYDFSDTDVKAGVYYYQLVQTDVDGKNHSSQIVTLVRNEDGDQQITVYPIPSHESIHIVWSSTQIADQVFTITDVLGREINRVEVAAIKGTNSYLLDILYLPVGTYFIQTEVDGKRMVTKFIKN